MPYTRARAHRYRGCCQPSCENPRSIAHVPPHNVFTVALTALIFAVIAWALARHAAEPRLVDVNLPIMAATPAAPPDTAFVVTVTTANPGGIGEGEFPRRTLGTGECLVYLDDNHPVSSGELYARAFDRLDSFVAASFTAESAYLRLPQTRPLAFQFRADATTPWRCVGGVISIAQVSGYPQVSLLTHPVRP